mmetsp:Transcript_682/g.1886  ORF Transcript_682/g.1886 Transcript_682/m.1886 type:complete len:157 (-) Transcript_682:438-908(-)
MNLALVALAFAPVCHVRIGVAPPSKLLALRGGGMRPPLMAFEGGNSTMAAGAAASVSGVLGYCTGRAAKFATSSVTVGVGAVVCPVGILSKAGYVTIHYEKVERDLLTLLDFNKDGQLDTGDYTFACQRFVRFFADNGVASAAGFTAGFWAGFKQD